MISAIRSAHTYKHTEPNVRMRACEKRTHATALLIVSTPRRVRALCSGVRALCLSVVRTDKIYNCTKVNAVLTYRIPLAAWFRCMHICMTICK